VQQLLFAATGDVLDCCFASLIKKGQKDKGRFELIAACGMKAWTPVPGPSSFTSLLVSQLPGYALQGITASELASRLREHPDITGKRAQSYYDSWLLIQIDRDTSTS
jgi:hypothetical protein